MILLFRDRLTGVEGLLREREKKRRRRLPALCIDKAVKCGVRVTAKVRETPNRSRRAFVLVKILISKKTNQALLKGRRGDEKEGKTEGKNCEGG